MTTIGRSAASAAWAGDSVVLGAVIVALVPMGVLHVVGSADVDPVAHTISDYVALSGGYTLIGVSAVALAVAGLVLAAGLGSARLPRARTVGALLVGWAGALMVVAVFPTNYPGTPVGFTSWVHRFGGAVVFTLLPVIVAFIAADARRAAQWAGAARGLRWWSAGASAFCVVFLVVQVPVAFGLPTLLPGIGLVQRVLFATMMVLLVVVARATRAAAEQLAEAPERVAVSAAAHSTAERLHPEGRHAECGDTA